MKSHIRTALLLAGFTASISTPALASECLNKALARYTVARSAAHAFDFYAGNWKITMRQRQVDEKLTSRSPWVSFPASVAVRPVLHGGGFVESYQINKPTGTKYAAGARLYDAKHNMWTMYWANRGEGQWQPPARGGNVTDQGIDVLYDDTWGSRAIVTRYRWITKDPNHPRWEQSFSGDCGATWISNWIMEFTRTSKS